jgi:glycosyltransferase involved in cell wall biosynthesis
LVEVYILNLNFGSFLPNCLTSLKLNGLNPIVLDGHSSDNSLDVAKRFNVKALVFNEDMSVRINFAINNFSSDYLMFFASDCVLIPGFIEKAKKFLDAHQDFGAVYGYSIPVNKEKQRIGSFLHGGVFLKDRLHHANFIDLSNAVIRRKSLKGFKMPANTYHPDWLMWLYISEQWKFKNLYRPSIYYTIHERQASKTKRTILINEREAILEQYGKARVPFLYTGITWSENGLNRFLSLLQRK